MDQKKFNLIALGEILWDVYPDGARFGGAPANFACTAAGLAKDRLHVSIVSAVGRDTLGEGALDILKKRHIDTSHVAQLDQATGIVMVHLDEEGRATYDFAPDCAWDKLPASPELLKLADNTQALCFGTLGQRSEISRHTIQSFVAATPADCLRILDVNLRPPFVTDSTLIESLELANVLKLSDEEISHIAELTHLSGSDTEVLQQVAKKFDLQVVALTRGPDGALLIQGEEISDQPAIQTQSVDTVGAGDAFAATLAIGLLDQIPLDQINLQACTIAAYVCSQNGATPQIPDSLISIANS
ncbi:MAG: carbohydrate kinase [Verrucomicrobiota bacterium]